MIDALTTILGWGLHWAGVVIVLNFLAACAEHELWLWAKRNPDQANRLVQRVDRWVASLEEKA